MHSDDSQKWELAFGKGYEELRDSSQYQGRCQGIFPQSIVELRIDAQRFLIGGLNSGAPLDSRMTEKNKSAAFREEG